MSLVQYCLQHVYTLQYILITLPLHLHYTTLPLHLHYTTLLHLHCVAHESFYTHTYPITPPNTFRGTRAQDNTHQSLQHLRTFAPFLLTMFLANTYTPMPQTLSLADPVEAQEEANFYALLFLGIGLLAAVSVFTQVCCVVCVRIVVSV